MKKRIYKIAAFLLIFALCFPVFSAAEPETAYAAQAPSLNYSKKTIILGTTYTLTVSGVTDSKAIYSWSSSETSVATVNGKGKVTPKKAGTAKITCKITYSDRTTKSLTCTVTVKARTAATAIVISNSKIGSMNAQVMQVGEKYDFNRTLTPSGSTDSTYWVIADEGYATVDSQGVVTAKKAGITRLEARVGINKTEALKPANTVTDSIYLYITSSGTTITPTPAPTGPVTPTPTPAPTTAPDQAVVKNVGLTGSKELCVSFGAPVLESSVIGVDGYLSNTITIMAKDSNANPPGILTPSLSADKRTLSIKSSAPFEGNYSIVISGVRTAAGAAVNTYARELELKDKTGPTIIGKTTVDAAGYKNTIQFNEELDLSELTILGVKTYVSDMTKSILMDRYLYSLSPDNSAIIVDLSGITDSSDLNKEIVVSVNMVKDTAGNYMTPMIVDLYLYTDTAMKAPSNPLSVERTSATTLTVTFDREVQYEGYLVVGNDSFYGTKDTSDPRKVNYNIGLNYNVQALTGTQKVTVKNWYSYNSPADSANISKDFMVNFTVSTQAPVLQSQKLYSTVENNNSVIKLVLTYDKNVLVSDQSGTLNATLYDAYGNILQRTVVYTASVKDNVVTLEVDQQMGSAGTYMIELPQGFVFDTYMNFSQKASFSVVKQTGSTGNTLPNPTVTQDAYDPSILYVEFAAKLDQATAQNPSNYLLANAIAPVKAELVAQSDSGAKVRLTFASGAIEYDTNYVMKVNGVQGYGGSYGAITNFTTNVYLKENKPPVFITAKITGPNTIEILFQENGSLMGTPVFSVSVNGKTISSSAWCTGSSVNITTYETISSGLAILSPGYGNSITDINGNVASVPSTIQAVRSY